MKPGFRKLYRTLHKTSRKRSERQMELVVCPLSKEIPNWRKCTTIKPLEEITNEPT